MPDYADRAKRMLGALTGRPIPDTPFLPDSTTPVPPDYAPGTPPHIELTHEQLVSPMYGGKERYQHEVEKSLANIRKYGNVFSMAYGDWLPRHTTTPVPIYAVDKSLGNISYNKNSTTGGTLTLGSSGAAGKTTSDPRHQNDVRVYKHSGVFPHSATGTAIHEIDHSVRLSWPRESLVSARNRLEQDLIDAADGKPPRPRASVDYDVAQALAMDNQLVRAMNSDLTESELDALAHKYATAWGNTPGDSVYDADAAFARNHAQYLLQPAEIDPRVADMRRHYTWRTGESVDTVEQAQKAWNDAFKAGYGDTSAVHSPMTSLDAGDAIVMQSAPKRIRELMLLRMIQGFPAVAAPVAAGAAASQGEQ